MNKPLHYSFLQSNPSEYFPPQTPNKIAPYLVKHSFLKSSKFFSEINLFSSPYTSL